MPEEYMEIFRKEKAQFFATGLLGISAVLMVVALSSLNPAPFKRFFGNAMPALVFFIVALIGFALTFFLLRTGTFRIIGNDAGKGIRSAFWLALAFFSAICMVDYQFPFPETINVLFPGSLLFYPAFAYLVEIIFHLLPFFLLFIFLSRNDHSGCNQKAIWICVAIVSLIEPSFQTGFVTKEAPSWKTIYLFLHIWGINLASLTLWKRFDFISMYSLRMFYYLFWHILWGAVRLKLVF